MTNSTFNHLSGISYFKSTVKYCIGPRFQKWGCGWGERGHEGPSANNSLVSYLPTVNCLHFLCGLHSVCHFSEALGNTACFGQCTEVSFSTPCRCISSCAFSCVSCLQCLLLFKCIWAQVPWETLLQLLGCDGLLSLTVWETYGSSCDQHWAVIHLCSHRSTLQPLSTHASFPMENSSQKKEKVMTYCWWLMFSCTLKHTSLNPTTIPELFFTLLENRQLECNACQT